MVFLLAHERVNPRESSIRHRGSLKRDQHQAGFCYDKMIKKDTPPTSNKLIALYDTLCGVRSRGFGSEAGQAVVLPRTTIATPLHLSRFILPLLVRTQV